MVGASDFRVSMAGGVWNIGEWYETQSMKTTRECGLSNMTTVEETFQWMIFEEKRMD